MHAPMLFASTLLAAPLLLIQSPAEQASRQLNQEIARDRARAATEEAPAAGAARAAPAPLANAVARQLDADPAAGSPRTPGEDRTIDR